MFHIRDQIGVNERKDWADKQQLTEIADLLCTRKIEKAEQHAIELYGGLEESRTVREAAIERSADMDYVDRFSLGLHE